MAEFQDEQRSSGIETEEFLFDLIDDIRVIGHAIFMDQSCYIWLGSKEEPCTMGSLATAIPTRFSDMPLSTSLIHSSDDCSSDMAERLAFRFKIQVFVSWNLPESYESHVHLIDNQIITVLSKRFLTL